MGKAPVRVLGETAYPLTAPSARVRLASFAPFLRPHGIELTYHPTLTDEEYRILASSAPAARKAIVLGVSAARAVRSHTPHDLRMIHRLRLLSPLVGVDPPRRLDVYDLDDALFLGSPAQANRRFQWAKQEARRCVACMSRARVVIAGNSFLASHATRFAAHVEVVPTCVDPERQPLHEHGPREVVTVGWIGSHTTVAYLKPVLPALSALNRDRLRAKLVVVGGQLNAREHWVEQVPWSLAQENELLASFDVGLMPLPDTDWARGKCGYKILQYFSAGVPAIASPVGVSVELIGKERGLLANDERSWRVALTQLVDDVEARREQGATARQFVERDYSYVRWAPELAELLCSLAPA